MKRQLHILALGFLLASPEIALSADEPGPPKVDEIVARVNGEAIHEKQLKSAVEKSLAMFRRFGVREEDSDLVKRMQMKALDKVIGERLIHQESQKLTIENIDEKVEQKVSALQKKHGERFEQYLKMRSQTMESLRTSFRARVCLDEYLKEQGVLEPEIPEERIREAYEGSPKSYSREESIKVSHVLVAVDPPEEKGQAQKKAEAIRREILGGKEFAEMAKEHSTCNSASDGGSLGYIKRGFMPKEFDNVAFAMEVNAVSEVVESKFGYHIVKVFDKKAGGVIPYDEVRDFIKKYLQGKEEKVKLAEHMAELKEKATIEILLKD